MGLFLLIVALTAVATVAVAALLVTIFQHRQEARTPFVRLVDVNESTTDPVPWGTNWPSQYDGYRRTVDASETDFGGSSAMPASKLEEFPWLKRLYAGYAFSIDYREARGHAYMLHDQEVTERVTKRPQSGSCLHCHAAIIPTYRRLGLEALGQPAGPAELSAPFDWTAVMEGFRHSRELTYTDMHAELLKTPDGAAAHAPAIGADGDPHAAGGGHAHPVSCVDCHDPQTMHVRVTRPGFVEGIVALANSSDPVPHLPSIARWRAGNREQPYDPNTDATRQELRSFVCGQCHVEYYCGPKMTLTFPWGQGLKVENIEAFWDATQFDDGEQFFDYKHGETEAPVLKAQHPEFELWSQGIHARSGVSCADCHMPYERQGAMKVSSHWVRSPLLNINTSCQSCHKSSEADLTEKVRTIQSRTDALRDRAAGAMTDMLDAILEAKAAGASESDLQPLFDLQRKAMWRLDFISSENSHGFHADQESARILAESIDHSRQAVGLALRLRAPAAPPTAPGGDSVLGVTPAGGPGNETATPDPSP
ncbi:MAG: ammonia-forming cytochrome c nitrite reductase subunit c552 [Planctomycetaceae bacterium]|nr:ammonia-forming cytochrome c nitrite reductase subunit c552 [Planctomycetaceae bacterium]